MKRTLRDILLVARHELADSITSRRVAVVLILYVAGAMLACNGFISALNKIEVELTQTLGLATANTAGAVTDALWKSAAFRRMITHLVGDKSVALELLSVPPIALIYGWLAFTFTPILVMLSSSTRISEEVGSGSARFILVRIPRATFCLGKFVGQALEIILALTLSVAGAWCIARFRLPGMDDATVIRVMILYAWKAWLYSLAYVGLALGISQTTRSSNLAMGLGFAAWALTGILAGLANVYEGPGIQRIWQALTMLVPIGHRLDLWRSDPAHVIPAAVFLLSLSMVYLFLGHICFGRRDL
jgi:ABC-type transport system involved in multi-copper enzyme maturation permease subunit